MTAGLEQRLVVDVAVNAANKAEALDLLDERAGRERAAVGVPQAQQAFNN